MSTIEAETLKVEPDYTEVEMEGAQVALSAKGLLDLSTFVAGVIVAIGLAGVAGGILIALQKTVTYDYPGDVIPTVTHDNVAEGVAIALAAFFETCLLLIFTNAVFLFAKYVRYQAHRSIAE